MQLYLFLFLFLVAVFSSLVAINVTTVIIIIIYSRTVVSILAVLSNVVVWMVSTRPPISKFSSTFNSPLVTVPNAPTTIVIIVIFMSHSFLIPWQVLGTYPSFHFLSDLFWGQLVQQRSQFYNFTFFFCWLQLGLVFCPRLGDTFICQSPIEDCVCHFLRLVLVCAYTICSYGQI